MVAVSFDVRPFLTRSPSPVLRGRVGGWWACGWVLPRFLVLSFFCFLCRPALPAPPAPGGGGGGGGGPKPQSRSRQISDQQLHTASVWLSPSLPSPVRRGRNEKE